MIIIKSSLGKIRLNKFTQKHARQNNHRDPRSNKPILQALENSQYQVVEKLPSGWKGHKTYNVVLLVKTSFATFLVVLKEIAKQEFLFVTSYIPRPKQLKKYI